MLLRSGHQLERLPDEGHEGPQLRRHRDPHRSNTPPPASRRPQPLEVPPTNLSAYVGRRNPQGMDPAEQGYRPLGPSSSSNLPRPSVAPGLQPLAENVPGQGGGTQVDGQASQGLPRPIGSTNNGQSNLNSVAQNSGIGIEPAVVPPVVEPGVQVGSGLTPPVGGLRGDKS